MDAADAGRQLYGYSESIVWDHTPNTYASAYLAMVTGLVCAALTWTQWFGVKGEPFGLCMQTIFFCLFQGIGFGMAGIAFHIVDTRAERGELIDTDVWGTNSGWICPWFLASVVKPLCSGCLLGANAAYLGTSAARLRASQCANAIGVLVAMYEAFLICTDQVWSTPAPEFYWGLFATGVACGAVLLLGWGKEGMVWILAGLAIRLAGYLYVVFGPCGDSYDYYSQVGCSFLQDANKNLVFNLCMALSVIPLYFGPVQKSRNDQEYQNLLKTEQAAKTSGNRTCCTGCGY